MIGVPSEDLKTISQSIKEIDESIIPRHKKATGDDLTSIEEAKKEAAVYSDSINTKLKMLDML